MDSSFLLQLPTELLIRILSYLDHKDLTICTGVCRHLQTVLDTSVSLTCALELGLAGLSTCLDTDTGTGTGTNGLLTSSQILSLLRSREHAWSNLTWRGTWKVPVGRMYYMWDLCGSIFVGGRYEGQQSTPTAGGGGGGGVVQYPAVAVAVNTINVLDVFNLESYPDAQGSLRHLVLERAFATFAVDPAQDLLVLVDTADLDQAHAVWTLHIRALTTGLKHPKAKAAVLVVPVAHEYWVEEPGGRSDAEVLGDVIMFTQRRGPSRSGSISLLNWSTGLRIASIYPVLGDWSCTLLSDTELLVAERTSFQKRQPSLEYYQFDKTHKGISASSRCSFQLPFSEKEHTWRSLYCYAPASLTHTPGLDSPVRSGVYPFVYPASPQIIAFRFADGSTDPHGRSRKLDMFLLVDHLRKFAVKACRHETTKVVVVVPWDAWGLEGTRFFGEALPKVWQRNIRGYRVVLPATGTLLDFNRHMWDEEDEGVVMEATQVSLDNEGRVKIVSGLPYRELRLPYPFDYRNILLGDSIVCIGEDTNEHGKIKALRILRF